MKVADQEVEAFKRFLTLLPHGKDLELVILKAHLLVEEQIRQIVRERVRYPNALKDADLDCHQAICLAQALTNNEDPALWEAVKKLNNLRNEIAHKIEPKGLRNRIRNFIDTVNSGMKHKDEQILFELNLWSVFVGLSSLVNKPTAQVLKILKGKT